MAYSLKKAMENRKKAQPTMEVGKRRGKSQKKCIKHTQSIYNNEKNVTIDVANTARVRC